MMRVGEAFRRDRRGGTTIEFAVSALALLTLLIGMMQAGLAYWTWQALEGAAIEAARCAAINATSCKNVATTTTATASYAATAAQTRGLTGVRASNVTVTTGATAQTACGTTATVVSVALSYPFGPARLVGLPSQLTAAACFPLVSS